MSTASVTIRVDKSTKRAVSAVAEDFGFDTSPITRAFYQQIEREQGIPLNPECPKPNNESLESIREAEKIIAEKRPGYATAEEMLDAMGAQRLPKAEFTPQFQRDAKMAHPARSSDRRAQWTKTSS